MKFIFIAGIVMSAVFARADSQTVLTIQRTNYKEFKQLYYDVNFDATACQLDMANPFEVYYKDNLTGEKLAEFSSESQNYFGPAYDPAKVSPTEAPLEFKALDDVQKSLGLPTTLIASVSVNPETGLCEPRATIEYGDAQYVLEHIDIKVTKFFGFPTGVEWVYLKGNLDGDSITDCVVGSCN